MAHLNQPDPFDFPSTIERLSQRLSKLTADMATAENHATDGITIGNRAVSRDDTVAVLGKSLDAVPKAVWDTRRVALGTFRGLRFGLILHPQFAAEVYLEGETARQDTLSREHHGPRAVLNALERLAGSYASTCDSVRQDLAIAEAQRRDYHARLGKPFAHDSYLAELTLLRDQLKAGLGGNASEQNTKTETVSELAERIKVLKASHAIEATPARAGQRRSSAEKPVTARIRGKSEPMSTPESAIKADAVASSKTPRSPGESTVVEIAEHVAAPAAASRDSKLNGDGSATPLQSFQHRVATGRRRKEFQATLF